MLLAVELRGQEPGFVLVLELQFRELAAHFLADVEDALVGRELLLVELLLQIDNLLLHLAGLIHLTQQSLKLVQAGLDTLEQGREGDLLLGCFGLLLALVEGLLEHLAVVLELRDTADVLVLQLLVLVLEFSHLFVQRLQLLCDVSQSRAHLVEVFDDQRLFLDHRFAQMLYVLDLDGLEVFDGLELVVATADFALELV